MWFFKVFLSLVLCVGIVFTFLPNVHADDTSEAILKLLIKKGVISQGEVDAIKAEVAKKKPKAPEGIEERVEALEEKSEETGFLSLKGYKIDLKGAAEFEYVNVEDDNDTERIRRDATSEVNDVENPRFQVDKVTLRLTAMSEDENIGFSSEFEWDEGDTAFFDDAYIFIKGMEVGSTTNFAKLGLMSRYIEPKKVFESYPLNGFAWYEDEEYLFLYGGEYDDGWLYWRAELARANELNDKSPTESTQFEMIHDNRRTSNSSEIGNSVAGGGGIGIKFDTEKFGKFDIMGFGRAGKLTDEDVSWLQGLVGYSAIETSTSYRRAGVNFSYAWDNFGLRGQFMSSQDGTLTRKGWHVEPYYTIPIGWKYLDSITPAVQISGLDVDLKNDASDARTWDREKYTLGAILQINKNIKWINEYSINTEDTGRTEVGNDEVISQLKFSF